ncbi:hypothetical protein MPER_03464 [Moniliophthora perniciosa FA553]|nr:hypothetical protein MPER_03464 [Moniliophthora perniciosa FA553]
MNKNAGSTSNLIAGAQQPKRAKSHSFYEAKEAKRRKVINEFYATERAYVDGLELVYSQLYRHLELSSLLLLISQFTFTPT